MSSGLTHRFSASYTLAILNTIYAIFLGLLFTYFFSLSWISDKNEPQVKLMITSENWLLVSLLAAYFILDWFTTNVTVTILNGLNHLLLIGLTLLIAYLGSMVILAFDKHITMVYLLFSGYAIVVTAYDLILSRLPVMRQHVLCNVLTYSITLVRLCIGLLMLLPLGLTTLFKTSEVSVAANKQFFLVMISIYLLIKFARYFIYTDFVARKLVEGSQC